MPRRKKKFRPVSREVLVWSTTLAQTTGVDFSDLGQVEDENDDNLYDGSDDDNYDDDYEEEYGQYEKYEPGSGGSQQGRSTKVPKSVPLKQMRTQLQDRIHDLTERANEVCTAMPGPLGTTSSDLKSECTEQAKKAPKNTDEWEEDQYKNFDAEIDELLERLEDFDDAKRRLMARKQRVNERMEPLNENAIRVRNDTPVPFTAGINGLALQCQALFKEAAGMDAWGASEFQSFEQKITDVEFQVEALDGMFDLFPTAGDFGEWASKQQNVQAKTQFDLMNEAMQKQPPDLTTFGTALQELGRVRVKTEMEQQREQQLNSLRHMLNTVSNELAMELEKGFPNKNKLDGARKILAQAAARLQNDLKPLLRTFRKLDTNEFDTQLQGLKKRFKGLESENDELQATIEQLAEEKASREHLKSLNEKNTGPKTIQRANLAGHVTGFIIVEAVREVSARIKKWGMYADVEMVWSGRAENRSGPKTNVLHHHCNNNYKHNMLYDGTLILGTVDGHMEKDAEKHIHKREETVNGRKGTAQCEVALTATELLISVG
jgi:hypothetical protein